MEDYPLLSTPYYPVFPQLEEKKKCFSIGTISLKLSNIETIIYFFKNIIINIRCHSYDRNQSEIIKIKFMLTEK